jgi:hypothetical protein
MPIGLLRILFPRFIRRPVRRMSRGPFGRLVAHFLARLVRGGNPAPDAEFELGAGGLLGVLAAPGALNCFLLFDKYSSFLNWVRGRLNLDPLITSAGDKYFYIVLAMAVCGIVTVLKWDKILPDSQDYLNLAPLPIKARTIFLANASAILIAVVVIALDVNLIPSVLFPAFVSASGHMNVAATLHFMGVHALSVILASLFAICGVFALMGMLSAILPRAAFRACASWVRGILLLAFIALLVTGFAGSTLLRSLERFPNSAVQWLPPLWYLGLYQSLQDRATPAMQKLAGYAVTASIGVFALMAISYGVSYRRRFAAVLENQKTQSRRLFAAGLAVLDLFADRTDGFRRACHRFTIRALLRNETHLLAIAVSVGLGWLLALQAGTIEAAPLICAYLLILGLRIAFELPASLPANWIFRAILDPKENQTAGIAHRVMLSFLVPLVLAPSLAIACWQWGFAAGVLHTLYVLALSWILMEILLAGYRKLPLTSPMPGFRDHFLMLCLIQLVGFGIFTRVGAGMERWMFQMPARFLLVPSVMLAAWYWNRRRITDSRAAGELEEGLLFENAPVRTVERLNLSDNI